MRSFNTNNASQWPPALFLSSFIIGLLIGYGLFSRSSEWSSCATEPITANSNTLSHVIIPFPFPKQYSLVVNNIEKWWTQFPPCYLAQSLNPTVHLIFYLAISDNEPTTFNLTENKFSYCFASVKICAVKIQESENRHIQGARVLFENLLKDSCLPTPRHFALVADPDVIPIRPNWLEEIKLYLKTNLPQGSWFAGSMFQGDLSKVQSTSYLFNRYHLNGNSLINLSRKDKEMTFFDFYFNLVVPYVDGRSKNAHDTDIFEFLAQPSSFDVVRRYAAHKIHATLFIINLWKTPWTLNDIQEKYPLSVFVHGGYPSIFEQRDFV